MSQLCAKKPPVVEDLLMAMLTVVLLMLQVEGGAAEIYSAILADTRTVNEAVIVIESVSLEIPLIAPAGNASWRAQFQGWPPEFMAVLEGRTRAPAVGPFAREEVPTGARLILRSKIDAVFQSPNPIAGWSQLEQAIGARTWQAFSRPVLTADGLQAFSLRRTPLWKSLRARQVLLVEPKKQERQVADH
jgi:hypothetical protein